MSDNSFYAQYLGADAPTDSPPRHPPSGAVTANIDTSRYAGQPDPTAAPAPAPRYVAAPPAPQAPPPSAEHVLAPPSRGVAGPPTGAGGYPPAGPPPRVGPPAHAPARVPPQGGHSGPASTSVGPLRASIREADLVKPYKEAPHTGWRKGLYRTTRINVGLSPSERRWNDLRHRVGRNLRGNYLVAVLQGKGGVGKTTVTVGLGSALSRHRDDKVAGIDANPAAGNLARRIDEPSQGTWRGLISDRRLEAYSDFRHYLGKSSSSGFEVLASDHGDRVITGAELTELWQRLQRQYPVGLIDCGTQLRDDVMAAVLAAVDAVVVVSTTRLDGAEGAADTLNWLVSHGYPHLVRSAVVMISDVNKVSASSSVHKLHEQFEKAVRAVHYVPYDPHLSDATAIDFDRLRPAVRRAFIEAAASLVDGFAAAADKDPGALGGGVPWAGGAPR